MRKALKDFKKDFMYTWQHKKAFIATEKKLTGKNTLRGYMHDTDKLFLYLLFTKKETSKIHRSYSKHHEENNLYKTHDDMVQTMIDWECNSLTKKDKPESAREFLCKKYPYEVNRYIPILEELGI